MIFTYVVASGVEQALACFATMPPSMSSSQMTRNRPDAALDVLHVENRLRPPRQQLSKQPLPLEQRPVAQVVAGNLQKIEGIKAERPALAYQLVKHRAAVRPGTHTHDLAVEDDAAAGELLAGSLRQPLVCPERIPVARDPPAGAAFDIRDGRPETVEFRLEDSVGVLKGRIEARQGHRSDAGEAHVTLFSRVGEPDALHFNQALAERNRQYPAGLKSLRRRQFNAIKYQQFPRFWGEMCDA